MEFVCLLTLIIFLHIKIRSSSSCSSHTTKGCEYCVQQKNIFGSCRWCELDGKCHNRGSVGPVNPCTTHQVITNDKFCPKREVSGDYSPGDSYNLLRLSAIPYAGNQNDAVNCLDSLKMNDFEIVDWIGSHCEDLPLFEYKECLAVVMISHTRKAIVLAYRGTASSKQLMDEFLSVILIPKVSVENGKGKVQKYFKKAHDKLYHCVKESMHAQISNYTDYNIWITGHSLGGALASISSASLLYDEIIKKDKTALYTFGMPRVGDRQYALEHNKLLNNSWRVTHHADPIPHLPFHTLLPGGPYHHKTEVYYPSKDMPPTENYTICPGSDGKCREPNFDHFNVDDHKVYFNIHVGNYCKSKQNSTKSAVGHLFSNNTCKNSSHSNHYNRAMLFGVYIQITMVSILLRRLLII